ncbi:major facilitator superfamily transporter [Xylariales sp. PMI_506]|nr:major facilitator superfamily transporter [Xylariales sp. PMI_506]
MAEKIDTASQQEARFEPPTGTSGSISSNQKEGVDQSSSQGGNASTRSKESFWRTVQRFVWDDPDKSAEEKKFLLKLDFFLLSYTCLGYFCKNLDQANISNAYVSGMQESLGMVGSELTYAGNVFTAGYVIIQLPAVILATKIRPSYIIPTLEVLWSVFTFLCATVKTVPQLYALRFLIGLCEGAFFPTIIYLIASWYTKSERGKRTTLFYSTASLASMFSGYLQAGAYDGLNGVLGHQGWQWLFIVCGIISLPVGVIGYFFNPDFPENTRAFYLTKEEAEFARKRLADDGYKPLGASAWDRKKIFRIFASWQFWVLSFGYFWVQSSYPSQQPFYSLWLKSTGHSVYQINVWPTGQAAVGVVTQVVAGMLSDSPLLRGRRWQAIMVMQGGTIFACIVLAIWDVPVGLKYACMYISWMAAGVPGIYYSWFPELMPHDHEMRGFMTAFSNMFSYINQIWYSDAFWRTAESPKFRPGFIAASTFGVVLILNSFLMRYLEVRDKKKREIDSEDGDAVRAVALAEAAERPSAV